MSTPTDPTLNLRKYLFKGHAIALRGSIRKPYHQELGNHLEISTYAGSRGQMRCSNRDFSVSNDIAYESASTEIVAEQFDDHIFQSIVTARVENLRIGNRLRVQEVICRLRSVYDARDYPQRIEARILPTGSTIKGLRLDDKELELELPAAFLPDEKTQDAFFRGQFDDDPVHYPGRIPEPIHVEDLGTIYYAEWVWAHPHERRRQHLTMLRLALGSDLGADIDVGFSDNDGSGWPPLAP
jgi:hypothetical protein